MRQVIKVPAICVCLRDRSGHKVTVGVSLRSPLDTSRDRSSTNCDTLIPPVTPLNNRSVELTCDGWRTLGLRMKMTSTFLGHAVVKFLKSRWWNSTLPPPPPKKSSTPLPSLPLLSLPPLPSFLLELGPLNPGKGSGSGEARVTVKHCQNLVTIARSTSGIRRREKENKKSSTSATQNDLRCSIAS